MACSEVEVLLCLCITSRRFYGPSNVGKTQQKSRMIQTSQWWAKLLSGCSSGSACQHQPKHQPRIRED